MREVSIAEAASIQGVSVDTIRRRVKRGELQSRQNGKGRLLVLVDVEEATIGEPDPAIAVERERIETELRHTREVLDEVRRQRDQLGAQVEAQQAQIVAMQDARQQDAVERSELRQLLAATQGQLQRLLPAPKSVDEAVEAEKKRRSWWPWRR